MSRAKKKPATSNVVRLTPNIFAQFRDQYEAKGLWWRPVSPGTRAVKSEGWQKPEWQPEPEHLDPTIGWGGGLALGSPLPDGTVLGCLDVDDDRYVKLAIAVLGAAPCARFGSKGLGIFVRAPAGTKYEVYRNDKTGDKVGEGLYTGGFTVCPPTISPRTKAPYRWVGTGILEMDLLSLPLLNPPLMRAALNSEHALEIATGAGTHDATLRFVGQLRVAGAEDDDYHRIVRALLPDDYSGNTLDELPKMVTSAQKKFSASAAATGTRLGFPDMTKFGPTRTLANTKFALGLLGVECQHNIFKRQYVVSGHTLANFVGEVSDPVLLRLREMICEQFKFDPATQTVLDAIQTLANHHRFHPVLDYLDGLTWDGTPRIDNWLVTYAGAEATDYVRAVGALFLVAGVRRVRQPGVKFDETLVLESEQGKNKSMALAVMAVKDEWFSDNVTLDATGKLAIEQLSGYWIIEIPELKGLRQGETERVKAFLSRQWDRARLSYERTPTNVPRQCVMFSTTNEATYLKDLSGNRRFWPVAIEGFDLEALRRDHDQLWAEAARREAEGVSIRLPEHLWAAAEEEQLERMADNPFLATLTFILTHQQTKEPVEGKIEIEELWMALGIKPERRSQRLIEQVGAAMRALGWERRRLRTGDKKRAYHYLKGDEPHHYVVLAPLDADGTPCQATYENERRY